jgi:hypothetical protein
MSDLVCIKTFANRSMAEMAKSILEDNGIEALVSADEFGMLGFTPNGAKLFVLHTHAEQAAEILDVDEEVEE